MDRLFYIENTINEWHSSISGYFHTLDEAKEGLKECNDWYRPKGTGRIYSVKFGGIGFDKDIKLEYRVE